MERTRTKRHFGILALTGLAALTTLIAAVPAMGDSLLIDSGKEAVAVQVATLFRSCRAVISKNQGRNFRLALYRDFNRRVPLALRVTARTQPSALAKPVARTEPKNSRLAAY